MTDTALITGINEWLVDQALGEPDIVEMFEGLCLRLHGIGVPVVRARLTWPTLHPLFQAETILWRRGKATEFEQFIHQEQASEAWLTSPMKYMFDHHLDVLRRHLDGPNKLIDFPVLDEMVDQGMTDYFVVATALSGRDGIDMKPKSGIVVTWCADRPGGFSDAEIAALQRIQRRFAVACKTVIQSRIARNITTAYLGQNAGNRVLNGEIRLGDGKETQAVVWYSDLRNSTAIADTMSGEAFIRMLNVYFKCTAGPVIDAGGEVLDFIGDAVLAIFPVETDADLPEAARAASAAIEDALERSRQVNADRAIAGRRTFRFSIALNLGEVMFGNIGVAQRLSFSVIGPTVNEVARIEKLTRQMDVPALAAEVVGAAAPEYWRRSGQETLAGVAEPVCLFDWSSVH